MAAAALPSRIATGEQEARPPAGRKSVSPVMSRLSAYMREAGSRSLPDEVIEKTKHHVLDSIASMISGSQLLPGQQAIRFARAYGGEKVATVAASDVQCGPMEAALANAMLAQADETDDSHSRSRSHPGCSIVPATLAAGERFGIGGERFLRAVALGYDVGTRVTMTLGTADFQDKGHRSTHTFVAVFGSSAAAACAANLNAQQMRWVLDYAAQQASGVTAWRRDTEHIEKSFVFAGLGARAGVTAALVVQSGLTGVNDIFSGSDNFFMAYAPDADPAGLVDKLGARYEVTRTDIKKWSVGSPIQGALDGLDNLLKRHPFEPDQVQKVVVRIAPYLAFTVNNRLMPDICMQHLVAVMLIDKTVSFRAAHDKERMQDSAVLRERAKVELVADKELEKLLPRREAIVEVTLTDGTKLTEHVEAVRGTPANPMSRDEVAAKARDLMTPVLGAAGSTDLIEHVLAFENVNDVRELRALLQRT
jgi:2-methylcitrate dehydratase PrpD